MSNSMNRFNYDEKFDILYYLFSNTNNSYGDEICDRVVLLRDLDTFNVTGIAVLDFMKHSIHDEYIVNIMSSYIDIQDVLSKININGGK